MTTDELFLWALQYHPVPPLSYHMPVLFYAALCPFQVCCCHMIPVLLHSTTTVSMINISFYTE